MLLAIIRFRNLYTLFNFTQPYLLDSLLYLSVQWKSFCKLSMFKQLTVCLADTNPTNYCANFTLAKEGNVSNLLLLFEQLYLYDKMLSMRSLEKSTAALLLFVYSYSNDMLRNIFSYTPLALKNPHPSAQIYVYKMTVNFSTEKRITV